MMIYGIGTDIIDIRRIRDTVERRGERFAEKVLGENELAVYRARRARVAQRGLSYWKIVLTKRFVTSCNNRQHHSSGI